MEKFQPHKEFILFSKIYFMVSFFLDEARHSLKAQIKPLTKQSFQSHFSLQPKGKSILINVHSFQLFTFLQK